MNKNFKQRGWSPTDYNPNILRDMGEKSVEEFIERHAPSNERYPSDPAAPRPAIAFAQEFFDGYQRALAALQTADPKGRVIRAFKQPPIAPKLILKTTGEAQDILGGSMFGGIPDLRRKLGFLINHNRYMAESSSGKFRTPADILRNLWPSDPDGAPMMFVAQFIFQPHIILSWDYFARELVSEYGSYIAPFSGKSPERESDWTRSYCFFRSEKAPFYDPRLDCGMIDEQWFEGSDDEKLMSEEEYLSIVAEAIPQTCTTHMDDSGLRWSATGSAITGMKLSFELDILSNYNWSDAPKLDTWDIAEAFNNAFGEEERGPSLFGAPSSQQTEKRFIDPNSYRRPTMMRPWLNWDDDEHDFTWQICLAGKGMEGFVTWGKIDGSCT